MILDIIFLGRKIRRTYIIILHFMKVDEACCIHIFLTSYLASRRRKSLLAAIKDVSIFRRKLRYRTSCLQSSCIALAACSASAVILNSTGCIGGHPA